MDVHAITKALIAVGEKGAVIARTVRAEQELLSLLVQEKCSLEKNDRFVDDFKTLTDVLVQETVRHDLSIQFPGLEKTFHGEESNKFTNALGETIIVDVKDTQSETSQLLEKVLNGDKQASELLSKAVHTDVKITSGMSIKPGDYMLEPNSIGVWIDPIDSTAQYINGENGQVNENGLAEQGLQIALVLIGIYDLQTGKPLIGVINQPFHQYDHTNNIWIGDFVWGISLPNLHISSLQMTTHQWKGLVVLSSSEDESIQSALSKVSKVIYASGAGYKMLATVLGLVDAYVISKNTTYKWDVCGPHAIIKSLGGGVVNYSKAIQMYKDKSGVVQDTDFDQIQVGYSIPDTIGGEGASVWSNKGGIIVYSNTDCLRKILQSLI